MNLISKDLLQIQQHGISLEDIYEQLNFFKNGIPKANLVEAATVGNGINYLTLTDFEEKALFFEKNKTNIKLIKFVPASGAATRMFKFLNEFLNDFDIENESINAYINRKKGKELAYFIVGLEKFPFYKEVNNRLKEIYPNFKSLEKEYKNYYFIKTLLSPEHFDYANKPKGILSFHKYKSHVATAIEEHLQECALYASSNGISHLHLTVSEKHQTLFDRSIKKIKSKIEEETETIINVTYSIQNKSTDTLAVDIENNPLRGEDQQLVFRPGGHGALIENLNSLDADIVFIKNIDNVIQNQREGIALYKKALAGILLELQHQIFGYLLNIETATTEDLNKIVMFVTSNLNLKIQNSYLEYNLKDKIDFLKALLDRPIRVCGMVKNEGETGGGPFWVQDGDGIVSLQIVETSQVDADNPDQVAILKSATHFNPADLVCGIKNYKNVKFDLTQFIDKKGGFIVEKNKNGKALKGYELPGLWNGAMANWITVFVEIPLFTFNPVKTVNDLLKPVHQI